MQKEGNRMKVFLATAVAASVVVGVADQASAEQERKYKRYYKSYRYEEAYGYRASPRWYPRSADKLPFGSKIWYEQMEREGRFGGNGRGGR
jgi:hypothetical protein